MVELSLNRLAGSARCNDVLVVGSSLGTSAAALWTRCAALLDGFDVVGWDLPGHGRSLPADVRFSVRDLAVAVRDATAGVAGGRRLFYAGVSLGGAVGLELALDPGSLCAVAVLASAPKIGDPAAWYQRAGVVRESGCAAMVNGSAQRWFAPGFTKKHAEVAETLLASLSQTDALSYAFACEALGAFDLRDRVDALSVPILLGAGEHDKVITVEAATHRVPNATVAVLKGCGHLPPAEDPAAVATLLADFFARQRCAR